MQPFINKVTGNLTAIEGESVDGYGVDGSSIQGPGGHFTSEQSSGVVGRSKSANYDWGAVHGLNVGGGTGVVGRSHHGVGVRGSSDTNVAVRGESYSSVGVRGESDINEGVQAVTRSTTTSALAAYQENVASGTAALYAKHSRVDGAKGTAAEFVGNVHVTGDISVTGDITVKGDITLTNPNGDCAEDFDISAESSAEPGMVMVLDDESTLRDSLHPYDKRVAGVVSGAGNYKPGLVLDKQQAQSNRKPIALLGKVFCKVDAQFGPIAVGDLLTTSSTRGHAMRADDPLKAFGAVIGKALRPLSDGQGLIPILIALQ